MLGVCIAFAFFCSNSSKTPQGINTLIKNQIPLIHYCKVQIYKLVGFQCIKFLAIVIHYYNILICYHRRDRCIYILYAVRSRTRLSQQSAAEECAAGDGVQHCTRDATDDDPDFARGGNL